MIFRQERENFAVKITESVDSMAMWKSFALVADTGNVSGSWEATLYISQAIDLGLFKKKNKKKT